MDLLLSLQIHRIHTLDPEVPSPGWPSAPAASHMEDSGRYIHHSPENVDMHFRSLPVTSPGLPGDVLLLFPFESCSQKPLPSVLEGHFLRSPSVLPLQPLPFPYWETVFLLRFLLLSVLFSYAYSCLTYKRQVPYGICLISSLNYSSVFVSFDSSTKISSSSSFSSASFSSSKSSSSK